MSQRNPWVEVRLGGSFQVTNLEIENRPDGTCQERLGNFKVFADKKLLGLFNYEQMQGRPPKLLVPVNEVIQSIRIQIEGTAYLHLGTLRAIGVRGHIDPVGGLVDLALGRPVTMSSQYGNFIPQYLVDGNPQTFMHTMNQVANVFYPRASFVSCVLSCSYLPTV